MGRMRRAVSMILAVGIFLTSFSALAANEEINALFEAAANQLKTPTQLGIESGIYALHPGETAYVPAVAPDITPYDQKDTLVLPPVNGSFSSTEESIVTVNAQGLMTAIHPGEARVIYHSAEGDIPYEITVSRDTPTELGKNMAYIARKEYYQVKRARLPKYNQYAKWYYGKKNEVGWCSVFGIWCANAAGANPIKEKEAVDIPDEETLFLREGQVGNQYDGFYALDRFGPIPRVGYMVIYAEMKNAYRTTHIGIVVNAEELGNGIYRVTTVEGNMSNSVKSYCYLYDSNLVNHQVGKEKGLKLQWNMSKMPDEQQTDPLVQYDLHTDHWSVFGFCETWKR